MITKKKLDYENLKITCNNRKLELYSLSNMTEEFYPVFVDPFRQRFYESVEETDEIIPGKFHCASK